MAELLERNVVIELEDIGNDQDKAFLIGTVLIRLYEHLRMREKGEQAKKDRGFEPYHRDRRSAPSPEKCHGT